MAHVTTPAPVGALIESSKATLIAKSLAWVGIVGLAVGFILKYVFHYYLHYDQASFNPYWPRRGGLLLHISGGMLALVTGPWQFWTGLRMKHMQVHRWTGRLFLLGAAMGVVGAAYLAFTTTFGWAFATGLIGLACAWAGTCTPEILAYGRLAQRVYVQTIEPRDDEFLGSLALNLRTVPLAANAWLATSRQTRIFERKSDMLGAIRSA